MKRMLFLCTILLQFHLHILSQVVFQKYYTPLGSSRYYGNSVIQEADSGYFILGNAGMEYTVNERLILMRTDKFGDTVWSTNSNPFHSGKMRKTLDNSLIVCGSELRYHFWPPIASLRKYNLSGDTIWTRRYDQNTSTYLTALVPTQDSGFVAVGSWMTGLNRADIFVIKTNSVGDTLWTKRFGLSGRYNQGQCVLETGSNDIVVCAISGTFDTSGINVDSLSVLFIKTNSSGNLIIQKVFSFNKYIEAYCITTTDDGGYLISGSTDSKAFFIKTDSNGDSLWTKQVFVDNYYSTARYVIPSGDSTYVWCGEGSLNIFGENSFVVLGKINNSGSNLWVKTYQIGPSRIGREVIPCSDQGFGIIGDGNLNSIYMIKTDEEGVITDISENNRKLPELLTFPNPFADQITVNSALDIQSLTLMNSMGAVVPDVNTIVSVTGAIIILNSPVFPGLYLLKIVFTNGDTRIVRLVHHQ